MSHRLGWDAARGVIALAILLVFALFTFETAHHSTHHLPKANQSPKCVIASASGHVTGAAVDAVVLRNPLNLLFDIIPSFSSSGSPLRHLTPKQGRAPPVAIA
jgi:hypothetical protein